MGKSKYADLYKNKANTSSNVRATSQRNIDLEDTRNRLINFLLEYKNMLGQTTLLQNMTQQEKINTTKLLESINTSAIDLNNRNVGEGTLALGVSALNCILLLHEEINQLKYHNFYLTKRIEQLENKKEVSKTEEVRKDDSTTETSENST